MFRSCMFLMTGPAHLPYLVVALKSLRQHWSGGVVVYAWPESFDIVKQVCRDPNIDATPILFEPHYRGKNAQEICKIYIISKNDRVDTMLYLDADILIQAPIEHLFDVAERSTFAGVQFCDWTVDRSTARKRVERLRGIEGIDENCIELALQHGNVSYNSGIFAAQPSAEILKTWYDWTLRSKHIFISGETALHAAMKKHPEAAAVMGGHFNCSPKYKPQDLQDSDVAIWHFHGDSNVRPSKCQKGVDLWWPKFEQAMQEDAGNITTWIDSIPNEYLQDLRKVNA